MSANNYILIEQINGEKYRITERDADTDEVFGRRYTINGLRRAIYKAQKMYIGGDIEYGITFSFKEDKKK